MKSPAFTVWPSVKPTFCNVPAIWVRMVTVSNGVTVPRASMVSGMSPVMTGATRTVWGGCAGRRELSSRLAEGAALSYFFHATNAAAARAATIAIHNSQFRRRGGAGSTIVGATGAGAEGSNPFARSKLYLSDPDTRVTERSLRQAAFLEELFERGDREVFAGRFE